MKLLERYLQAVRFFLPKNQQEDILRELEENLIAQMEDRAEELDRPLTDDEVSEILRRHGHPIIVAGRYRAQQHLIGPVFFPVYWFTLKVGLGVAAIVTLVLGLVGGFLYGDPVRQVVTALLEYPGRALMVFAWTTLCFAILDFAQVRLRITGDWNPGNLPQLVAKEDLLSRTNAFAEAFFSLAAVIWLLALPGNQWLAFGPAAAFLDAAPVWGLVYAPILLLTAATAVFATVNGLLPIWTPARSAIRIALHVGSFAIVAILLQAGEWVVARPGASLPGATSSEGLVQLVNNILPMGLAVAAIIAIVEIVREAFRWRARRRERMSSNQTSAHPAR